MYGYCKHLVATLFEVLDFKHDERKTTCTSKPYSWRRRVCEAEKLSQSIPATQTPLFSQQGTHSLKSPKSNYCPLPEDVLKPDSNIFLNQLQILCPKACLLKSVFQPSKDNISTPPLTVTTPMKKLNSFISSHSCIVENCSCATIFMYYHLPNISEQCTEKEEDPRGQSKTTTGMCVEEDGILVVKQSHKYYYQIQGQMALTGIPKSFLVLYTHKGIANDFDEDYWSSIRSKLVSFYRDSYFKVLKDSVIVL